MTDKLDENRFAINMAEYWLKQLNNPALGELVDAELELVDHDHDHFKVHVTTTTTSLILHLSRVTTH